jgi:hypothetical protein
MYSCSNDFELTEGLVDIPIVYGLITVGDTATYIRVERAFADEKTSAYILSKDPEKLYYNDAIVKIRHIKTAKDYTLTRVDGNLEGYKRDAGAFADAPNYLYKIKKSQLNFIAGDQYRLIISKNDGSILTEATTVALTPYQNEDITNPGPSANLSFSNNTTLRIKWNADVNSYISDIRFTFNFIEDKNGKRSEKSVVWTVIKNLDKNEYSFKGRAFYEFMQGAMEKDPQIKRYFKNASLSLVSGGKELKDYISIGQANLGITSSGEIPVYTNLSKEGKGIFSSKTQFTRTDIGLGNATLDSLRYGSLTKVLNFQ